MRATAADGIELLDLSSRVRKIGQWFTFTVNGWQVPDAARVVIGIPNTPPGNETISELQKLRRRLLELAKLEPPSGSGWAADPYTQVAEATRLCGEIYDLILERRSDAAAAFRQAADDYRCCGMTEEATKAAQRVATLEDSASGDLEAQIAAGLEATKQVPRGTLKSALCRIELGELLLQAGDTYRARDALLQAEADMEAAGYVEPPDGMAVLDGMISGIGGTSEPALMPQAGEVLRLRLAFHRLYNGLARAFDVIDSKKAEGYRQKIEYYRLLTPRPFGP